MNLDDFEIDPGILDYQDSPDYGQDQDFEDVEVRDCEVQLGVVIALWQDL